jgi:hypothetical protein
MNLIQSKKHTVVCLEEELRIFHFSTYRGQLTIEILHVLKALAQHGLANASHTGEPYNRPVLHKQLYARLPPWPLNDHA